MQSDAHGQQNNRSGEIEEDEIVGIESHCLAWLKATRAMIEKPINSPTPNNANAGW